MDKRNLAFGRVNFILLAFGMVIVILGFILMSGQGSSEAQFNPDIFSSMRVKVAPVVCFVGFASMVFAIIYRTKDKQTNEDNNVANNKAVISQKKK
ncbi:MAG: DUF3098 domain-containing protein [Prevotella sp.]|jgi:heme/copper-type cytochrome/quinol oxidase subunit 2|nr:DUF3098 domain-containing protein [Prevotella sp.]